MQCLSRTHPERGDSAGGSSAPPRQRGFVLEFENSLSFTVESSFKQQKQFDAFKAFLQTTDSNVILDGANIGFANANNKKNMKNGIYLNVGNIAAMVSQFQSQQLKPLVILHSYHLRHLKDRTEQMAILDVLVKRQFHS